MKNKDYSTIQKYHQAGHKVYLYNYPQVGEERPETYRRHYGLILWQAGADGVMNYAYQDGFGFIYNDFDFSKYKDHVFAYPTVDGVIGTLQWEGFREGVDDMRYLSTLLAEIKSAKAKGRNTSAAETYLASLKQSNLATVDLDTVRGELASWIGKVKAL